MGIAEAVITGVFELLRVALVIGFWFLLAPAIGRFFRKHMGGAWGTVDGSLGAFSPRRLWCRHPVASYCQGAHGLWAVWCTYCGRKLGGR